MNTKTVQIVFALFIVAHGLIQMSLARVPAPQPGGLHTPFFPAWWRPEIDSTWLAVKMGLPANIVRVLGWMLWSVSLAAFVLAALGYLGVPSLAAIWQICLIIGAVTSLLLLTFFGHPWLFMGVLIDVALLLSLRFNWPHVLFTK